MNTATPTINQQDYNDIPVSLRHHPVTIVKGVSESLGGYETVLTPLIQTLCLAGISMAFQPSKLPYLAVTPLLVTGAAFALAGLSAGWDQLPANKKIRPTYAAKAWGLVEHEGAIGKVDYPRPNLLNPTIQTFIKGAALGGAFAAFIAFNTELGVPFVVAASVLSGASLYGPRKLTHALAQKIWPTHKTWEGNEAELQGLQEQGDAYDIAVAKQKLTQLKNYKATKRAIEEHKVQEWLIGPGFWKGYQKFVDFTSLAGAGAVISLLSGGCPCVLAYPILATFGGNLLVAAGLALNARGWDIHKGHFEPPTFKTFKKGALWGGAVGLLASLVAINMATGPINRLQMGIGLLKITGGCALAVGAVAYSSRWQLSRVQF